MQERERMRLERKYLLLGFIDINASNSGKSL